jgi:hypothetical protein
VGWGGGGVEGWKGGGGGGGVGGEGARIHGARSLDLSTITRTCDNINVSNMCYIVLNKPHPDTLLWGMLFDYVCITQTKEFYKQNISNYPQHIQYIPPKIKIAPHSTRTYLKMTDFFETARARSTFRFV